MQVSEAIHVQRASLLRRLQVKLDQPLAVLGVVWLVLVVVEMTRGLGPFLTGLTMAIWVVFLLDFALKLILASDKLGFLRSNLLTAISLAVPALRTVRLLRVLRASRAARGLRLLRLLTSMNRGMRSLGMSLRRRGFGYVLLSTLLVLVGGAAGMYAFERDTANGLADFGSALWWTAMILTTMGSEFWPKTAEGRLLCLFLSIYGFSIFGYVTATFATFFIASDVKQRGGGIGTSTP